MKKHALRKWFVSGAMVAAALTFQSCQSKQSQPDCPAEKSTDDKKDCDKDKRIKNCDPGCKDEEANGEVMTRVIEIDQPEAATASEETVVEVPADAPVEASVTPPAAEPAQPTASAEAVVVEVAPVEAVSPL